MMKNNLSLLVFLVVEIAIALFVLSTVEGLPETVATHFNRSGTPNGFMPRSVYLVFILVFSAGIPAFAIGSILLALRIAPASVNFPNRNIWLAPANKQQTIQYLRRHIPWVGSLLGLFLGYVHWTILQANSVAPARLSTAGIMVGTGVFLAATFVWVTLLMLKFRRPPES